MDEQLNDSMTQLAQLVDYAAQFKAAGRMEEAGAAATRIIQLTHTPITPVERRARGEAFNFLAAMSAQKEQFGTAMDFFHQAISLANDPEEIVLYRMNLARILLQITWIERARQEIERCKRMAPEHLLAQAYTLSGLCAREEGNGPLAAEEYRKAAEAVPDDVAAQLGYASILADTAKLDEAEALYRKYMNDPEYGMEAEHGVGLCLMRNMRFHEAIEHFNNVLRQDNGLSMAHWNRALSLLSVGEYKDGWREHEWRFNLGSQMNGVGTPARRFARARWNGKSAAEIGVKRLHFHSEMGLGDTLQFCRYALIARDMGHDVRVETNPELVQLLKDSLDGVTVMEAAKDWPGGFGIPEFDMHAPMMSLPMMVGTTLETIPWDGPYLKATPEKIAKWRDLLADVPGPRVGICWHGRSRSQLWVKELDNRRSLEFSTIAEKLIKRVQAAEASFVSLDLQSVGEPYGFRFHQFGEHIHDFSDTAALVENLDLVIAVDTSVAHLAAGMGKETWLLSRWDRCWRWLEPDRTTSPWYPAMKIYSQPTQGDWAPVLDDVVADLRQVVTDWQKEAAC